MKATRSGFTLIELVVVLAILSILGGIAGLGFAGAPRASDAGLRSPRAANALEVAVRERRTVSVTVEHEGRALDLTALPDGQVVADPRLRLDRRTGEVLDER